MDVTTLLRHGYFAMYPDFASIKNVLPQVIKKASASLQVGPIESLNVLHIGFATHCNNEVIKSALRYSKTDNIRYHIAHQARDRPNFPLIFSISLCHPQDESSALAKSALAAYQYDLKKMSLRAVNVLLVNPGKKVRSYLHAIYSL